MAFVDLDFGGAATGGKSAESSDCDLGESDDLVEVGGRWTGGSLVFGGPDFGGSASVELESGGDTTGGAATGGAATCGRGAGGCWTGGADTGGLDTGGADTGGLDKFGEAIGGETTGGAETGGNKPEEHFGQETDPSSAFSSFDWHCLQSFVTNLVADNYWFYYSSLQVYFTGILATSWIIDPVPPRLLLTIG